MKNYVKILDNGQICLYINGAGMHRFATVSGLVNYLNTNGVEAFWL